MSTLLEPKSTTDICDENEAALPLPSSLRHFGGKRAFAGVVVTVQCFEDNSRVKELVQSPGEHRVLLVDGGGSTRCALLGDMLATAAHKNGWAGLVVYGCVRDTAVLAALDLGVMALAASPKRSMKNDEGRANVAIDIAGVRVRPGDTLHADDDGAVIIPSQND
jgi:regulator of ribonuclease activity A